MGKKEEGAANFLDAEKGAAISKGFKFPKQTKRIKELRKKIANAHGSLRSTENIREISGWTDEIANLESEMK